MAILDTGVDPSAAGLQETSEGLPKVVEVRDCSGVGDVELVKVISSNVIQSKGKLLKSIMSSSLRPPLFL